MNLSIQWHSRIISGAGANHDRGPVSLPVGPGQRPGGDPGGKQVLHFTVLKTGLKIHAFSFELQKKTTLCSGSFEFYRHGHCTMLLPPKSKRKLEL